MSEESVVVTGRCLICSTPNTSVHFGFDACRACTSFFKRAQLSGHRFPCRRGDHKCPITRGAGLMCRGCRYDKCAALGMTYDGPLRTNKECNPSEDHSIPSSSKTEESLLDRIAREHAICMERRRVQEMELIKHHKLVQLPNLSQEVYLANFECAIESFKVTVTETWNFLIAVFPSIKELPYDEQREFFRLCCPQFVIVESFFRTKKIFGMFRKYSMCSVLICSDHEHPEVWIGPMDGGPMRKNLLEFIRVYLDDQMSMMVPSFENADICEREQHALLALLLSEAELRSDLAERFQPFLEEIRKQTVHDLQRYYTEEMGLSEYSTRLGRLFTICLTFRESNVLFREFFRMQVTIFDLYMAETLLKDLLM